MSQGLRYLSLVRVASCRSWCAPTGSFRTILAMRTVQSSKSRGVHNQRVNTFKSRSISRSERGRHLLVPLPTGHKMSNVGGMKYGGYLGTSPELYEYLEKHSYRPNKHLDNLHKETMESQERPGMCSPPASIPLLQMLVKLTQASKVVEIGVFTGYTALGMALALPEGGVVHACDISPEYPAVGEPHWKAAGVADKIKLHIGPANDTLVELLAADGEGTFDMGFIDADKTGYNSYYELVLRLLRPGGVIAVDNVLRCGRVLEENPTNEDTQAIKTINDKIFKDDRVDICMLPISDGVTLVRKK